MRPARPDEEDQQYVVRRMGRGRSQPPPGVAQDDYHTWHGPHSRGASRGEMQLGSPVGECTWDIPGVLRGDDVSPF